MIEQNIEEETYEEESTEDSYLNDSETEEKKIDIHKHLFEPLCQCRCCVARSFNKPIQGVAV